MQIVDEATLPPPDAMVRRADGSLIAFMFYHAVEGVNLLHVAQDHGFDVLSVSIYDETFDEADPIPDKLEQMEDVMDLWHPRREGWQLANKFDTEDGPVALFIRPAKKAAA